MHNIGEGTNCTGPRKVPVQGEPKVTQTAVNRLHKKVNSLRSEFNELANVTADAVEAIHQHLNEHGKMIAETRQTLNERAQAGEEFKKLTINNFEDLGQVVRMILDHLGLEVFDNRVVELRKLKKRGRKNGQANIARPLPAAGLARLPQAAPGLGRFSSH